MKKIDRYLIKTVLQSILLILACLVVLQIFILLVNQMGDLGKGYYHFTQALAFVFCRLPYELSLSFPVISLIGVLMGLSQLANHGELGILRANGLSILNIINVVAKAGVGLILVVMILAESFVPHLMLKANTLKLEAMNEGQLLRQAHALWFRNQDNFWFIADVHAANQLHEVTMFKKDEDGRLKSIEYYPEIVWQQDQWFSQTRQKTDFYPEKIMHQNRNKVQGIDLPLSPDFFKHLEQNPDEMSLGALWRRVYQLKHRQNVAKDELVLWQRILQPWNTFMMMLLAIPCIFGPLRSSTMGAKLLTGIALGFAFYIFNQMFGFISQVYQIAPILGASMPLLLFSLLGILLFYRGKQAS